MSPFFGKPSRLSFFPKKNSQFNLWFIFSFLEFYLAIDSSREKSQLESNADNSACDAKKSQVGACAISSTWILITFIFFYKANEFLNKCNLRQKLFYFYVDKICM